MKLHLKEMRKTKDTEIREAILKVNSKVLNYAVLISILKHIK